MKVRVVAENYISKENIPTAEILFRELIAETLKETGCIEYTLQTDLADETHFIFMETWETQASLDAHAKTEHFTRIVPQIGALTYKEAPTYFLSIFE